MHDLEECIVQESVEGYILYKVAHFLWSYDIEGGLSNQIQ